jgi:hypothetical protein
MKFLELFVMSEYRTIGSVQKLSNGFAVGCRTLSEHVLAQCWPQSDHFYNSKLKKGNQN